YGMMFLPVIGPFVMAGKEDLISENARSVARALLIFGGISQAVGIGLTILGLVIKSEYEVPVESSLSFSPYLGSTDGRSMVFGFTLRGRSWLPAAPPSS
ncbi:MAG: hypothetical protein KKI08_04080, partial [Armatimonadetes bacterium]|nr:hypothetical protein [Armatimonadota bacterium]